MSEKKKKGLGRTREFKGVREAAGKSAIEIRPCENTSIRDSMKLSDGERNLFFGGGRGETPGVENWRKKRREGGQERRTNAKDCSMIISIVRREGQNRGKGDSAIGGGWVCGLDSNERKEKTRRKSLTRRKREFSFLGRDDACSRGERARRKEQRSGKKGTEGGGKRESLGE